MKSLLTAALSCVLSLLLFRFVVATSSEPAPAVAAAPQEKGGPLAPQTPQAATTTPTTTTTTPATVPSSLLGLLFSPAPTRSPLTALYVTRPALPTRPLAENGCIFKSVALANDCRFAFDAMQAVESGSRLETALAISRASRQAGAAAAQKCSEAAGAFYGSGCACEPAVVLGLKFVDIVPARAKEALLEISKKCPPAAPSPSSSGGAGGDENGGVTLADALSMLSSFLDSGRGAGGGAPSSSSFKAPPPPPPPRAVENPEVKESGGGAPLRGL